MQKTYTFWGQCSDSRKEAKFLAFALPEIQNRNKIGFLLGALAFLFVGFSDPFRIGFTTNLYFIISLRILFFVFALYLYFNYTKIKSIEKLNVLTIIFATLILFFVIIIIKFLNTSDYISIIDLFTFPITVLTMYVFLNISAQYLAIVGLSASIVFVNMISHYNNVSSSYLYVLTVMIMVINFMGIYLSRFFNISRRNDHKRLREIQILNSTMRDEIEERRIIQDKLIVAYSEITESMRYANHLQVAMLPELHVLDSYISDHFLFYQPCDIVSGDFYWVSTKNDKIVIAVADCTGHGIRAGFMSIIGISFLEDIVHNKKVYEANEVLNKLKSQIVKTLNQTSNQPSHHDGMDISICIIDKQKMELQFSGAFSPLVMIRNNQITEYKGDRMPVSYYFAAQTSFTNHIISILPDDQFYMFTDGYRDQFGGEKDKKFSYKRLKRELQINSQQSMESQRKHLKNSHITWKGKNQQTDDIILLGFKI